MGSLTKSALASVLAGALLSPAVVAQAPGPSRADALVALCDVWSTVKYLDPQLMEREVDWDGALVRAIPRVREVQDHDALAREVGSMLAELGDPLTRVSRRDVRREAGATVKLIEWQDDVLVVNIGPFADSVAEEIELIGLEGQLFPELEKAKRVVFDLRTHRRQSPGWILENLTLVKEPVAVPAMRYVFHSGYSPQSETTSGKYFSAIQVIASPSLDPPFGAGSVPSRFVFLIGNEVPVRAAALWWSGAAAIVAERPLSSADVAQTREVELGGGWVASVRIAEAVGEGLSADAVIAPEANGGTGDAAMQKAMALARDPSPLPRRPAPRPTPIAAIARKDATYREMASPELPYRLLALFRLWSVIDRFYPYRDLIGDWDGVLREFISRFEAAEGAEAYARTIFEMAARIEDGHTQVYGHWGAKAVWDLVGTTDVPVEVRAVEGRFIVTAKMQGLPPETPIAVGDEVVSVDGEPMAEAVRRRWPLFTASTEEARMARVVFQALRGPHRSIARLEVRGAAGNIRVVEIARVRGPLWKVEEGDAWRVLDGNIGYVDLTRLTDDQVDPMFDAVMGTRAIVFDMRGYPPSAAGWAVASRLNTKAAETKTPTSAASFRRPEVTGFSSFDWARMSAYFEQVLMPTDKPLYRGPTVMLIDERALSQAEQTGLWFEAANGTKFIGSNTAGANGDTTVLVLPGEIYVAFTGHDVRHADGRQLQRIGLVPDVAIRPTIEGIRSGRDEVLEGAIAYLKR